MNFLRFTILYNTTRITILPGLLVISVTPIIPPMIATEKLDEDVPTMNMIIIVYNTHTHTECMYYQML